MYTVCWKVRINDLKTLHKWEQCESRREVAALLFREGLEDAKEIFIFSPDAEEHMLIPEDIFTAL